MQRSLLNCTIVVFFVAISLAARADVYKAGDSLIGFSAPDQHGTDVTFTGLFLNQQGVVTDIRFAAPGQELRELLINKTATSG